MRFFSVFAKCNYRYVHCFADNERMGLFAFRASSPPLVIVQDAFCMVSRHSVESELAFVSTTTLVVGYFAVAEAATIFGFEERTFHTITWCRFHLMDSVVNISSAIRSASLAKAGYANSLSCCVGGLCQHREHEVRANFCLPILAGRGLHHRSFPSFVGGENNYRIAQIAGCFNHYLTFSKNYVYTIDRSSRDMG